MAASLAGKAAEMVTLLLLATVVPRVLGPADYGRFSVALTVVTVGSLALTLGGPTLMSRFVPAAAPADRLALAWTLGARLARGRALQLVALAAAAVAAVIWDPAGFPPLLTAVVGVALALNVAATLGLQVLLGLGRTVAWSVRYPLQNSVLLGGVMVLHPRFGSTGAAVAILVAAVAASGFAAFAVRPIVGAVGGRVALPDGVIRFGVLQAAGAALTQFAHRAGVIAVALLAGSTVETGYAALAIGTALGVTYAILQAFTVSLPHLARGEPADPDVDDPEAILRRLAGVLLVVLLPCTAVAAASLDFVVPAVFGSDYGSAATSFGPALALIVLAPVNALAVQVAALRLRPEASLASGAAAALAFVVTSAAAVPGWGASGGTSAALAGTCAAALVSVRLLPGAIGGRLAGAAFGGAAAVLALPLVA